MKTRIALIILLLISLSINAQESVLLRVSYNLGDNYLIKAEQKTNMGLRGSTTMNVASTMTVTEAGDKEFKTKSKITSIVVDMISNGMSMSFDSNKKDEELDQKGKMLKSRFAPMMEGAIYNSLNDLGKVIETKTDPEITGINQLKSLVVRKINYPEEEVSVGSTWSSEKDGNRESKTSTTYTVTKIANGVVYVDVSGSTTGMAPGTSKGKIEIDIKSGVKRKEEVEIVVSTQGVDINMTIKATMEKI